uniref:Annexin n=1 Tax=Sinocyclocheilus anshuiensis TaxID=1608454 RepID=A0A671LBB1_9TELE
MIRCEHLHVLCFLHRLSIMQARRNWELMSPSSLRSSRGTIKAKANFNVSEDVAALRKAMEGIGTTEKTLIDILTHRSSSQKQAISKAYEETTNRILVNDLKGDTQGNFENLLVALARPPAVNDAKWLIKAMKGTGTDNSILIEILASRTNKQIKELSAAYAEETKKTLIQKLKTEVSGDFGKAILLLAEGARDESTNVNADKAREDAKTLQKSIEKEMSGNLEELLVDIVKCVMSTPAYFAEKVYKSMKGAGTDETTLTRVMVSRGEIDMLDIRAEFKKLYQNSLFKEISSDVSGNYGDCLNVICGGED